MSLEKNLLSGKESTDKEKVLQEDIMDEVAMYYQATSFGEDLIRTHKMDSKDLKDLLLDPEKYKNLFNLEDDDVEYMKDWIQKKVTEI